MINKKYRQYAEYYVKPRDSQETDKDRFDKAINSLKTEEKGNFRIVTGFCCRTQLMIYLKRLSKDISYIGYTDCLNDTFAPNKQNNPESRKQLVLAHIYFRGDTDEIIKAFNENGFIVLWTGDVKDVMMIATEYSLRREYNKDKNCSVKDIEYLFEE